jgi:HEAT repeat protein
MSDLVRLLPVDAEEVDEEYILANRLPGVLAGIGGPALPFLADAIAGTNANASHRAATALFWMDYEEELPPVPGSTIVNLIRALDAEEWRLRGAAVYALGGLRQSPVSVIPALEKRLADEHSNVRGLAATALGRFGAAASNSVPKLETLFDDINPNTARYAREAVERIRAAGGPKPTEPPEA